jgi:hypothetical protein
MSNYTKRTKDSTILQLEKRLNKYTNEVDKYKYFYRTLGEGLSLNKEVRRIWQDAIIGYMLKLGNNSNLQGFYHKVADASQNLPARKEFYLFPCRSDFEKHSKKMFPKEPRARTKKDEFIDLEAAIKFNLINKEAEPFGKFIAYEVPLEKSRSSGAIDCVAYNKEKNELRLIEIKRFRLENIQENREPLLRALTEIITYRLMFEYNLSNPQTGDRLRGELKKVCENINFEGLKIINCIFAPASMYKNVDKRIIDIFSSGDDMMKCELYTINSNAETTQYSIGCQKILFDIEKAQLEELT